MSTRSLTFTRSSTSLLPPHTSCPLPQLLLDLAEAAKLELEVRPLTGQEVDKLLQEIYATPRDVVKMASDALKQRDVQ